MNHREQTIAFIKATGLIPVEINPKDKAAVSTYSPSSIARQDHSAVLKRFYEKPDLNIGALFHGRWVDIDYDSFDPALAKALDIFLPPTPFVWGRTSKRRSHRAYTLDDNYDRAPFSQIFKLCGNLKLAGDKMGVEIRGGKPEAGKYAVMPGSFVALGKQKGYSEEGETIEWETIIDPSVTGIIVKLQELSNAVRLAQATAIIARYWTEGQRNDMSLALAGMLWRIHSMSHSVDEIGGEEYDPGFFVVDKALATRILEAVCQISGDDPKDWRSRVLNLNNTWDKLSRDNDFKATGGNKVAEMMGDDGKENVKNLYLLLSDNVELRKLEEWYDRFSLWYGRGDMVDMELVKMGQERPYMSRPQVRDSLGRHKVLIKEKFVPVAELLYQSPLVPIVYGFTLDPSTTDITIDVEGKAMINQWRGLAVQPHPEPVPVEYMKPLIDYFYQVLANNDQGLFDWVLAWVAHIFQTPAKKSRTSLVLVSALTGTGKTFLGEVVIAPMIGPAHSVAVESVEALVGKHNMVLSNKIFIQANEAVHSHKFAAAMLMKSLITDKTVSIEPKFVDRMTMPNFARFLFTSNRITDAVYIDPTGNERRFTVANVSTVKKGDTAYWATLKSWCEANYPKILRFLLDYKFDFDTICTPYETQAKRDVQASNAPYELVWLIDRLQDGFIISADTHQYWWQAFNSNHVTKAEKDGTTLSRRHWPNLFLWEAVEDDFNAFNKRRNRSVFNTNPRAMLKKLFPEGALEKGRQTDVRYRTKDGSTVIKRVRYYTLPSKKEIVDHLNIIYGEGIVTSMISSSTEDDVVEDLPELKEKY